MDEKRKKSSQPAKAIVIGVVILFAAVMVFLGYEIVHIERYETTSVEDIGIYKGTFDYEMSLFPKEENLEDENIALYEYKYRKCFAEDSQYVLLIYQYGDDYENEKERLSDVSNEYGYVTYSESKFDLPAYLYVYDEGDNIEFALIDDAKCQIKYVYMQHPHSFKRKMYEDAMRKNINNIIYENIIK